MVTNEQQMLAGELATQILSITRHLQEQKKRLKTGDISDLEMKIIRYVIEKKVPMMKDVSGHLRVTPPAISSVVEKLVKDKKVERLADTADRRMIRLQVTAKGRKGFVDRYWKQTEGIREVFAKLDEKEHLALLRMLKKISGADD